MKKISFGKSFARAMALVGIGNLVVIAVGSLIFTQHCLSNEETQFQQELGSWSDTITRVEEKEEDSEEIWTWLDYLLMLNYTDGTEVNNKAEGETYYLNNMRCQIVDIDGTVKASSNQAIMEICKLENQEDSSVYALEESQQEEVEAAIAELEERYATIYDTGDEVSFFIIRPDLIYVKENHFLIGSLGAYNISQEEGNEFFEENQATYTQVENISFDVDATGYQKVDLSQQNTSALLYSMGNAADSQVVTECQEYTEAYGYTGNGIPQSLSPFTYAIVGTQNVLIAGENYTYFLYEYYDLNEATNGIIWKAALGLILLSVLVTLGFTFPAFKKQKARAEMEDYRKNLTRTMAHDLKSPLMAISGYMDNLEETGDREKQQEYIAKTQNTVEYMNGMISGILYLSKLEATSSHLKKEEICMEDLIQTCLKKQEGQLTQEGISVKIQGHNSSKWNRETAEQVINNLLTNIAKYAKPKSTCQITLDKNQILFENAYEGKLDQTGEQLTECFVKGEAARTSGQGTGLGLAIAKNAVNLNGYQFQVEVKEGSFLVKIVIGKKASYL